MGIIGPVLNGLNYDIDIIKYMVDFVNPLVHLFLQIAA